MKRGEQDPPAPATGLEPTLPAPATGLEPTLPAPTARPRAVRAMAATVDASAANLRPRALSSGDAISGPAAIDAVGLTIVDPSNYRLGEEIAQGGIGRVRRARDARLSRPVAIKELLVANAATEERFLREAIVTARLQHPAIVPIYEAGRWPSGEPFYAMRLVSGRSLEEIIRELPAIDARLALLPNVLTVAEAVAYAHSEHIIHRDLKPANVLVGAFGETVVIDWGIAKDLREGGANGARDGDDEASRGPGGSSASRDDAGSGDNGDPRPASGDALTMDGAVMGTPAYMPPEQAAGQPVDERADVYSLGAILYHVLAGTPPYDGPDAPSVVAAVRRGPPIPLAQRQPGVPPDLLAIVDEAMAREPAARYPTAKELADDLRRFLTGQLVSAHRYSARDRALRYVRKHRGFFAMGALAIVVIGAVAGTSVSRVIDARRAAEVARDRAAEERDHAERASAEALARADDLTLVQARAVVLRDPNRAVDLLATLSPAFERWGEARLVAGAASARGFAKVLRGHTEALNAVAFSPDGTLAATTSDDRTARLWDLEGRSVRVLAGHTDEVWGLAFLEDGRSLLTFGKDRTLRRWDTTTGAGAVLAELPALVFGMRLMPDGRSVLLQSADAITVQDVATGEQKVFARPAERWQSRPAVSPDGARIAALAGGALHVYEVATGAVRTIAGDGGQRPFATQWSRFSPDGRRVITPSSGEGNGQIWELASGARVVLRGHAGPSSVVAFLPDGATAIVGGRDGALTLHDVPSGALRKRFEGHEGSVAALAVARDGRRAATGGADRTVRLWDLTSGESRVFSGFGDTVAWVAFSPDERTLVAGSHDHTARLFPIEASHDRVIATHGAFVRQALFTPDGAAVMSADGEGGVRLSPVGGGSAAVLQAGGPPMRSGAMSPRGDLFAFGAANGAILVLDRSGTTRAALRGHDAAVVALAFSPDGSKLVSGGHDGAVHVWDVATGADRLLHRQTGGVYAVGFSPDGARVASCGEDDIVRLVRLADGEKRELRGHSDHVQSLRFSPDGSLLATGAVDHKIFLWPVAGGEPRIIDAGGRGARWLVFSPDGARLVSLGGEAAVRIWDVATGKSARVMRGHTGEAQAAAFSPDGTRLVTGGEDKTLRLWDLASGESRVLGGHESGVTWVDFAPDGRTIVSGSEDGTARLWFDDLPLTPGGLRAWIATATSPKNDGSPAQ